MITISTYTEPQPVNPVVNESPQTHEPYEIEENDEPGEFARLLAGLLRKTNMEQDSEADDVPVMDFADLQVFNAEEINPGIFGFVQEAVKVSENDFSDIDVSEEYLFEEQNFLSETEYPLNHSDNHEISGIEDNGELPRDFSEVRAVHLAESKPSSQAELSSLTGMGETAEVFADLAQAAEETAREFSVKTENKKDGSRERVGENIEEPSLGSRRVGAGEELASLRNDSENRSRLDEVRSRNRRDRLTFDIHDTRTASGADGLKNTDMRLNTGMDINGQARNVPVQELTLELRLPQGQNPAGQFAQTTWEARAGSALENMLARELHQNFNGDIVRHASMALRDGGEGMIRLALRPESLGDVKIHLKMSENKITGHIVVESQEALNAFRKELDSLEQAFREAGFETTSLNLSLASEGRGTEGQQQDAGSLIPQTAAARYDDSSLHQGQEAARVDVFFGRKQSAINMLA